MSRVNIMLLLGGYWHDFEGFALFIRQLLQENNFAVDCTYDFDALTRLHEVDLILSYTCLNDPPSGIAKSAPAGFSQAQMLALTQYVQQGGAFLAAHASTIPGDTGPELERLIGGAFVSHPPEMTFSTLPLSGQHPISRGIEAFEVHDELYIERYNPSVEIHMVAENQRIAYPVAWSKSEGRGRVAHVALGHSRLVWENVSYQHLMMNAIQWLTSK